MFSPAKVLDVTIFGVLVVMIDRLDDHSSGLNFLSQTTFSSKSFKLKLSPLLGRNIVVQILHS